MSTSFTDVTDLTSIPGTDPTGTASADGSADEADSTGVSLDAAYKVRFIYAAVGSVGMLGNAIVIGVIMTSERMRRATTNVLIANQSAIDFSASLFIVLTTFIRDVGKVRGQLDKELFCRLWSDNLPIWGLFVSSTYNLVCITMERYTGIMHPMRHGLTCRRGRTRFVLVFSWLVGPAYNLAYMVPTSPYKDGRCTAYTEWPTLLVQRAVGLLTISVQFLLPLLIIGFAYVRILVRLRRHGAADVMDVGRQPARRGCSRTGGLREGRMRRARLNVVKTLVMVASSFVLCWSPNQIIYAMYNLGFPVDFNGAFYHFTVIAVFLNCCINPFIYALQYDQFKSELLRRCRRSPEASHSFATPQVSVHQAEVTQQRHHRQPIYVIDGGGGGGCYNNAYDEYTDL